jgi:hypothetical protein
MPRSLVLALLAVALASGLAFAAAARADAQSVVIAAKPSASTSAARGSSDGDTSSAVRAGNNIGNIAKAWGSALLLGIAGLMGLAALAKRNVGEGLTLIVLVVIIGGFLFADEAVKAFVQSLWGAVSGG